MVTLSLFPFNSPIKIGKSGRVPEPLGEGIRVYLELRDQLVLVGGDSCEDTLRKHKGLVVDILEFLRSCRDTLARGQAD